MKKTLFERLADSSKKKKQEKELFDKKLNSLSLVERNAYEEIIIRKSKESCDFEIIIDLMLVPFKFIFYTGIFSLVLKYAFDINIIKQLKNILFNFIYIYSSIFFILIIITIIGIGFNNINLRKLKRELLLKK
jgi:hypothetical protein